MEVAFSKLRAEYSIFAKVRILRNGNSHFCVLFSLLIMFSKMRKSLQDKGLRF